MQYTCCPSKDELKAALFVQSVAGLNFTAIVADFVGQRLVSKERFEVIECGARDVVQRFAGQKCLVSGHQHVRHREQARELVVFEYITRNVFVEKSASSLIHVKTDGADLTALYRLEQCFVSITPREVLIINTPSFISESARSSMI